MKASYKIRILPSAEKEIRSLERVHRIRVVRAIKKLARDPRPPGCQKLSREDHFRIRVGMYRIVYRIEGDLLIVEIIKVGHRREVYR